MRSICIVLVFASVSLVSNAQYKKASFIKKGGRTYETTLRGSIINQSSCFQPAVSISFGRDKEDSRLFNWHDIELTLPVNYSYNTTYSHYDNAGEQTTQLPAKVKARASSGLAYRFNMGYYLADNSNEDNKILPFVNVGASAMLYTDGKNYGYTTEPEEAAGYLDKYPSSDGNLSLGFNGGAGVLFRVTNWFGVKATAGYSLQLNTTNLGELDGSSTSRSFFYYKSHPYISLGLRFRVARSEDR